MTSVMLSAGDASGDATAADFVEALRRRRPGARFLGLAGCEMEKRGVEPVADQRDLAVGGLVELLPSAGRLRRAWRRMNAALVRERPDLVVLVDSAGFNLPLARRARAVGAAVLYYVPPQVWVWRPGRVRKLAQRVDRVAATLPFEPAFYGQRGLAVDYVGHPAVDRVAELPEARDPTGARRRLGLPVAGPVVALLPGSRRNELRSGAPAMLSAARRLHRRDPRIHFVLPVAPSVGTSAVAAALARSEAAGLPLALVAGQSLVALAACDVAILKPGTATLEAALLDRPSVVTGRLHPLTAALFRRLARVDRVALPNLIAGRAVVPELLQRDADPDAIADAAARLFEGAERARQRRGLAAVRRALGGGGAAARAAGIAAEMLDARGR